MATIYLAHASQSESGGINGTKGDQTGKEVLKQTWFSNPWDFIAIHPTAKVREAIAKSAEQAVANDKIGYGQSDRDTLNTRAKAVSYNLSKITTACNCDCSSFANVCCVAGGAVSSYAGWTTSVMKTKLKSAGFKIITASAYRKNSKYCVRGAIYVRSGYHCAIGLTDGASASKTLAKAGVTTITTTTTTTTTSTSSSSASSSNKLTAGKKVTLKSTNIYTNSTTSIKAGTKTGTFYLWDSTQTNGRIRITTQTKYVGVSGKVTAWVNVSDIS